jgi:hypothetical protein
MAMIKDCVLDTQAQVMRVTVGLVDGGGDHLVSFWTEGMTPEQISSVVDLIRVADLLPSSDCYFHDGRISSVPQQPTPVHVWSWAHVEWQVSLDDAKSHAWGEVKAAREAALVAPLPTPHGIFDCDAKSQDNIMRAYLYATRLASAGLPSDVSFTLADNTRPVFDVAQITDVALAMGAREKLLYDRAADLRRRIDGAETVAEVEAIKW